MPSQRRIQIDRIVVGTVAMAWALFQLALPRLLILDSATIRTVHLAFGITLAFLTQHTFKRENQQQAKHAISPLNYALAVIVCLCVAYFVIDWVGIVTRSANPLPRDIIASVVLVVLLLEAARRSLGPALTVIAVAFTVYAFLGQYMPSAIAFRGVSLRRYLSQIVMSTEGVFGIPLRVSASTVFLFVLFGSMLEKVGAGHFFNDLALCLFGRFKGGAAKAAIGASGLTGMVSGSSIANVVTTGTFTIPLMKKVGYPATIAAATEVAASTNGQLMPPIMGAAAFIIAEYLGIDYLAVVKAALVPAVVSYCALFYIAHIEASKLGMKGLPKSDIPSLKAVLKSGYHYLIPLLVLIYELIIVRRSPNLAAFYAITVLVLITLINGIAKAGRDDGKLGRATVNSITTIASGLIAGSRNMVSVAMATAAAGIVVGVVFMGLSGLIVEIVADLALGHVLPLLFIAAVTSLILGMGLPTTATYIVMASITVPIIVELDAAAKVPVIAAHLFCFYFGILADDTPPVGLAAYAAAAIAKADPIKTGIQGFIYDLRTAVIPFMFVFNSELILYGISSIWQGLLIFTMAVFGACAFANAVQGWLLTRNKWYDIPVLLAASLVLFYPAILTDLLRLDHSLRYYMYLVGLGLYGVAILMQRARLRSPQIASS